VAVQRRMELFLLACAGALLVAVLSTLRLRGIDPFHDRHVGLALGFFVLTVILQAGAIAFQVRLWARLYGSGHLSAV
jgi:hypothetical protein